VGHSTFHIPIRRPFLEAATANLILSQSTPNRIFITYALVYGEYEAYNYKVQSTTRQEHHALACACRIPTLNKKIFFDVMKQNIVVIFYFAQLQKVFSGLGTCFCEQINDYFTQRCLQKDRHFFVKNGNLSS